MAALCGLLTVAAAPPVLATSAAQGPELRVQSTGSAADPRVRMVADSGLRDPDAVDGEDLSVAVSGTPVASRSVPLLSSSTDLEVVLDTSPAARAGLASFRSGVTDLLLELPEGARSGVVAAGALPRVLAPLTPGATGALAQLSGLDASGEGQSSDGGTPATGTAAPGSSVSAALALALSGLGPAASDARPRVVVLHTNAPDAGGEPAAALAQRLRAASVVLEVVGSPAESAYWTPVAESTGGRLLTSAPAQLANSVTSVSDHLRHTFLVTFARSGTAAAQVALRVGGAGRGAGATVALPAGQPAGRAVGPSAPAAADDNRSSGGTMALVAVAAALLAAAGALVFQWERRRPRGRHEPGAPVEELLTLMARDPAPATAVSSQQSFDRATAAPAPVPAASAPQPTSPRPPAPEAVAADQELASDQEPRADQVVAFGQAPVPEQTSVSGQAPVPDQEPASAQVPVPGQARVPHQASLKTPEPASEGPSPAVTDAERRARAAGAAVAAAARAAARVRPAPGAGAHAQARHRGDTGGHLGHAADTTTDQEKDAPPPQP